MTLKTYRHKRDFQRTPEPRGNVSPNSSHNLYVIQKHAASHLHYDFRLELDGVLKSWAVPKGPSLDPKEKRLAVEVEDHPIEYGGFEGTIPKGEYGGGTVMLWDQGKWFPDGDPRDALRRGNLKFRLEGEKLTGRFHLVLMRGKSESKPTWLLMKENDDEARVLNKGNILEEAPNSVLTGRTMEEIAENSDHVWQSNRKKASKRLSFSANSSKQKSKVVGEPVQLDLAQLAKSDGIRKGPMPAEIDAQLATLVDEAPKGKEWVHEIKFDGYRILARIEKGKVTLTTRNGNDWTRRFAALADRIAGLTVKSAVLDGEVVIVEPDGKTNFQALQNALNQTRTNDLVYYAFDLLFLDGYDLRPLPVVRRKGILAELLAKQNSDENIRFSSHIEGQGQSFFQQACRFALEGIISKRGDQPYRAGRNTDWLKVKCLERQEFVIGGFTDPQGTRSGFGALLIGVHDAKGNLVYCGKVGTGYTFDSLKELRGKLSKLEQDRSPFVNSTRGARIHWVKPSLVAQVGFSGWTQDGSLRHPVFEGLREDKPPKKVVRELPRHTPPDMTKRTNESMAVTPEKKSAVSSGKAVIAGITLSHPDKILFPEQGITKLELAQYYEAVADWILPFISGRPLTLVRCPEGHKKACFYQRHSGAGLSGSVEKVKIKTKEETRDFLYVTSLTGIISLVQIGVLEFHTWGARYDSIERPDQLVFDLDPDPAVTLERVVEGGFRTRDLLKELGLKSFVKLSGGKGIHVVLPIERRHGWSEVEKFSRGVADELVRRFPEDYTANMLKVKRKGKIFIDYLRNARSATAVVAYSTRAREGAPVSTPISWSELSADAAPNQFNIRNLQERLASLRKDPWADYAKTKQSLGKAIKALKAG